MATSEYDVIRKARGLVKPRYDHVPTWLGKRLRQRFNLQGQRLTKWRVVLAASGNAAGGAGWLDHWGVAIHDGDECFTAEPYLNPDDLPDIKRFSERAGFKLENHGTERSWWRPGETTLLVFRP